MSFLAMLMERREVANPLQRPRRQQDQNVKVELTFR
jgi:hypothetical protein